MSHFEEQRYRRNEERRHREMIAAQLTVGYLPSTVVNSPAGVVAIYRQMLEELTPKPVAEEAGAPGETDC